MTFKHRSGYDLELLPEHNAESWITNSNLEKAKSCRNHFRDYIGGIEYPHEGVEIRYLATDALRLTTIQQWESFKDMIYELTFIQDYLLKDIRTELARHGHVTM
jgi:hypothetical protein